MPLVIDSISAWVSRDEEGNEGICGFNSPLGWMPMIAADEERLKSLRPFAEDVARTTGRPVYRVQFYLRREVENIGA